MSLAYGIWARPGRDIPREWQRYLESAGSPDHSSHVYSDRRLYLRKIDIEAFAPGWSETPGHVISLAGDAILTKGPRDRSHDMAALASGDLEPLLRRSRGYFGLVHYDKRTHELTLANDRLGMRPLYVYDDGNLVVFSGAIRFIENLPGIRLTLDLTGALESATFGFPLGERTHYQEIKYFSGGTLWQDGAVSRYWVWEEQPLRTDVEAVMDQMYATFQDAVALRRGGQRVVHVGLSGGLDSRCVATALWTQQAEVHSVNCSWKGSYDDILARMYAERLGFTHHYRERALNDAGISLAWHLWEIAGKAKQIWAGNDASLSIGHNRQTQAVVAALKAGQKETAAKEFLNAGRIALSGKLLKGDRTRWAESLPLHSLLSELPDCHERSLWLFRLRNHHRRITAFHFEQIDTVPFEFIEPTADPELIQLVATLPIDFCLRHHMYHEWLKRFPPEIMTVAWQSYPGHLPCPIALPPGFAQWAAPLESSRSRLGSLRQALRQLGRSDPVLSRPRVAMSYLLHGLKLRDTSHLLKQAELIEAALQRC